MSFNSSADQAKTMDVSDELAFCRKRFFIPPGKKRKEQIYLTGNSLGLQPKSVETYIRQELEDWKTLGVEGHFQGKNPWFYYHKFFPEKLATIVGANESEVAVMNNLTVNLHLLMVSFYHPTQKRYKILMEAGAFPSDMYVVESQLKYHGYDYNEAVVEVKPREGEYHLRDEDILEAIEQHKESLALVFFSGVQYYSGQVFDIPGITAKAHEAGALAGFDLAHAAGNIALNLHDWDVDFAAWCGYKYLNSGPGGVSGIFVHDKHGLNPETRRFAGWWGHKEDVRFLMQRGYIPEPGAAGWQLSNAPVLSMAAHMASLEIFKDAGMSKLIVKSGLMHQYLRDTIMHTQNQNKALSFKIITPTQSGCQLSILCHKNGKEIFDFLMENDVVADWREPDVIRMAPVPLYNTFEEIYDLGQILNSFRPG